jgi:UDP-N-acetylmuramoyl-tripeptide--D-alanyl-D-alanine ligase
LFVALVGEKRDGHEFVSDVLAKGGFAMVRKGFSDQPGLIVVDDPLLGLQNFATAYLAERDIPVVAVTGSNGKTSTKDMIAQVLRSRYAVHSTQGNYNNEIGVPLTVLGVGEGDEVLVAEMGMRGLGQIKRLTEICPPDLGVITNIGPVHLELLGSMGNVAQAKGELLEALDEDGVAILNGDDPSVRGQARSFKGKIIYYGLDAANDLVASGIAIDLEGRPSFNVRYEGQEAQVTLAVPGVHNVWNACAALAVGARFGVTLQAGAEALADLTLSAMRLEVQRTPDGIVVLNDSYNASPASMKVALDTLAHMYCSGQRIAILGDMLELGDMAEEAHLDIGAYAKRSATQLFFIGEYAPLMQEGAGTGQVFATVEDFLATGFEASEDDLVLIKASRGLKFERIVDQLMKGGS